jgi:hypothetical protein
MPLAALWNPAEGNGFQFMAIAPNENQKIMFLNKASGGTELRWL